MTAPWTPRERRMREALEKVKQECLHPLECKVFDPEDGRHAVIWAVEAAEVEAIVNAALAEPPTPDPRDEALRLAEEALDTFSRAYVVSMEPFISGIDPADGASHWMPGGWPTVGEFKAAHEALAAIAAAKGEK